MKIQALMWNMCQLNSHEWRDMGTGLPAGLAANAIHLCDCCCEETAKGTGYSSCGEEDGGANAELGSPVPARKIIIHTWKEAGFGQTKLFRSRVRVHSE